MRNKLLLALAIAATFVPTAQAWAPLGHRLVGALAEPHLSPNAQRTVSMLLEGEADPTLAGIANWADELRGTDPERFKATSSWHYVNTPRGECVVDFARDCPDGQCVVGQIEAQAEILADATRPNAERRDALKFLVHFVGDAHQPFHASNQGDLGGNTVKLALRTPIEPEAYARASYSNGVMQTNLHSVWDYYILASANLDTAAYTQKLQAWGWPETPTQMSPAQAWTGESCRLITQRNTYPTTTDLDITYLDTYRPLAEQRVRQAAFRLAYLINAALDR